MEIEAMKSFQAFERNDITETEELLEN